MAMFGTSIPALEGMMRGCLRNTFAALGFVILSAACNEEKGIISPEPPTGTVTGLTAHYDSLDVTLARVNPSWYPRDNGEAPQAGEVFVTLLFHAINKSGSMRQVHAPDFQLHAIDHNDVKRAWESISEGRQPLLTQADLAPTEEREEWLTFRIPQDTVGEIVTSQVLDDVMWSPAPGVSLSIPFPSGGSERTYEAQFIGRVTDAEGTPLAGITVQLEPINPYLGPPSVFQNCKGGVEPTQEYITNASGWYEGVFLLSPVSFELCINVRAIPPGGSGAGFADSSGSWIHMGVNTSFVERPELRIDLILP